MSSMPEFLKDMVKAAAVAGSLHMTYYIPGTKEKQTFDSTNSPLTFVMRKTHLDDDERFFKRVLDQLHLTLEKANIGKEDSSEAEGQEQNENNSDMV